MNNKGFTLIELLATIVLISVLGGIATVSVISVINTSKNKSEKIFVDKIGTAIETYLSLNSSSFSKMDGDAFSGKFNKETGRNNYTLERDYNEFERSDGFNLSDLIKANLISTDSFINPKNKEQCFDDGNYPNIRVFRDSDFVTYYYVSLENNVCGINEDNLIISNIPKSLCSALRNKDSSINCKSE